MVFSIQYGGSYRIAIHPKTIIGGRGKKPEKLPVPQLSDYVSYTQSETTFI